MALFSNPIFFFPLILLFAVALAEVYALVGSTVIDPTYAPLAVNAVLACVVLWSRRRRVPKRHGLGARAHPKLYYYRPAFAVLILALGGALVSSGLGDATGSSISQQQWLWILVVPFIEEVVFRVGFGGWIRQRFVPWAGMYVSALFFALMHTLPTVNRVANMEVGIPLGVLLLGIACEWLYSKSERLGPIVALHMACNATVVIFALVDSRWLLWLDILYM